MLSLFIVRITVDHLSIPLREFDGAVKPFRFRVAMVIFAFLLLFLGRVPWVGAGPGVGSRGCAGGGFSSRVRVGPSWPAGRAVWLCWVFIYGGGLWKRDSGGS